jgi:hypothetical protein
MSSDPNTSDEEFSDFVRRPTRRAGDLSDVAESSAEITMKDVASDLESIASKSRTAPRESCSSNSSGGRKLDDQGLVIAETIRVEHW